MLKKLLFSFLLFVCFSPSLFAKTDIEFILDASGSMRAAMGGKTQMDVAKESIRSALELLPSDVFVALRVYAHRVEQADKVGSCQDTELMIPFSPLDKAAFTARLMAIQPKGYTPIGYSLREAGKDLSAGGVREADRVLILVSDGEETCGTDPVQVVKDLQAQGIKFKLHAVGFNVDARAQAQLKSIAQAGGGQYYDARDASGLAHSLKDITQKALVIQKTESVYGSEVRGGDSYEKAVALPLDKEVHLDHHQKKGQYDYFFIDLKSGESLTLTMTTIAKGVSIRDQSNTIENDNVYAGYQIHDSQRNKVGGDEFIGQKNTTRSLEFVAPTAQKYFVLIGSLYEDMHKDHTFKGVKKSYPDAGTDSDAGSTPETALSIQKQSYLVNYLTKGDDADLFKLTTAVGENLVVKIIPDNPKSTLMAGLYDDLRAEVSRASAPNEGAGFRLTGSAKGTTTFLKIQRAFGDEATKYSIEFEGAPLAETIPTTPPSLPSVPQEVTPPVTVQPEPAAPPVVIAESPPSSQKSLTILWTSPQVLKVLGGVFGLGLLLGFLLGFIVKRKTVKKD